MSAQDSRFTPGLRSFGRTIATGLMLGLTLLAATPARAAFHLWTIREVYTDASGTNQFIELFCVTAGQVFVGGQSLTVSSGGTNHTVTLSTNVPDTASRAILIGTVGITNFGAPPPNYIISNSFIFPGGGSISFFGANSGAYT